MLVRRIGWTILSLALLLFLVFCVVLAYSLYLPYENSRELERRASGGDATAQFVLGRAYQTGAMRVYSLGRIGQDPNKATYWYTQSALKGNAKACYVLAVMYEQEFSGTKNREAMHWYQEAAKQGSSDAALRLSAIFRQGLLDQKVDLRLADYWARKARRSP